MLNLVGLIYDCALDPAGWAVLLEELAKLVPAGKGALIIRDPRTGLTECAVVARVADEFVHSYATFYGQRDPWLAEAHKVAVGIAVPGEALLSTADLVNTEFYNDFLCPQGLGRIEAVLVERSATSIMSVSVNSCLASADAGTEEMRALLQLLVPHLQRVAQVQRHIGALRQRGNAAEAALNGLAIGVCLLAADGSVCFANTAALRLLSWKDGLTLDRCGHLRAHAIDQQATLDALVDAAVRTGCGGCDSAGGTVAIERPSAKPALPVLVAPLRNVPIDGGAVAVALVSDLTVRHAPRAEQLAAQFGLTATESRLLQALTEGERPEQAADRLGVSITTIRSHLHNLLAKMHCASQSDLVRTALSSPAYVAAAAQADATDGRR